MKHFRKVLPVLLTWLCMTVCLTNAHADNNRVIGGWHVDLPDGTTCDMDINAEANDRNNPYHEGAVCNGFIVHYDNNFEMTRSYDVELYEKDKLRITYLDDNNNEVKFIVYTHLQDDGRLLLSSTDTESMHHPFSNKEFTRTGGGESQGETATAAAATDNAGGNAGDTDAVLSDGNETDGEIAEDDSESMSWGEIGKQILNALIGIAVVGLFLWMVGHMIYLLTRPKRFDHPITVEEMAALRKSRQLPDTMTEEEHETLTGYMDAVTENWTCIGTRDGEDQFTPTTKPQVDSTYDLLDRSIAMCPTDPDIVARINEVGEYLNDRCKRTFDGSKVMLIVAGLFTLLFIYLAGWVAAPFFLLSIGFYYLASLCPNFVLDKKMLKGSQRKTSNYFFAAIFGFMASAQTVRTITTYSDGHKEVDDDHSQHVIFTIIGIIAMLIMVYFLAVWGIVNYLRNYVFYK